MTKRFLVLLLAAIAASLPAFGSTPAGSESAPATLEAAHRPLRVGLVLSGGGARGFAHVGVLKVLEEAGVKVSVITATSMGSMVGGGYAEGYSADEIAKIVKSVDWSKMFVPKPERKDLNWRRKNDKLQGLSDTEIGIDSRGFALPYGIITTQELDLFLARVNAPASRVSDLSKLPIPYAAFATDLETGQAVLLQKDISLSHAMRSSLSIPGAFAPAEWKGKLLVDGGLVQNLPVDAARKMGADIVIAVNVGTPLLPKEKLGSIAGVMGQMLSILTEQNVNRSLRELRPEDILITPDLSKFTSGDFNQSEAIMKAGEDAARKILPRLKALGVPRTEYAAWNEERRRLTREPRTHQLADIRVDGLKTVNPKDVLKEIKLRPGDVVTTRDIEEADRKIWQEDEFLSVPYRLEPGPDGMEVLVFEPQEKTWGYSSFRFGGKVETDFDTANNFSFMLQHTVSWLNSWGGELRTLARIGDQTGLSIQFYQPLGAASPFYLKPELRMSRENYDVYDHGNRVSSWQNKAASGTLELGYEISRLGTVSVGGGYFTLRNSRYVGSSGETIPDRSGAAAFTDLSIDRIDRTSFPTSGYRLNATALHLLNGHDAGGGSNAFGASFLGAATFGPWTISPSVKMGRSSLEGLYKLGGAFNLTGAGYGRYTGDRMAFGRLAVYRSLSPKLMQIGAPVWAGITLEAGRAYNSQFGSRPGWTKAAGLFIGADTWIGPVYLITGRTSDNDKAIYFVWGYLLQ